MSVQTALPASHKKLHVRDDCLHLRLINPSEGLEILLFTSANFDQSKAALHDLVACYWD